MKKTLKVLIPILIAAVLLAWIYRDFDFSSFGQSLLSMDWGWMAASLVAGAMSYVIRGIRWRLLLEPMGVRATDALCINSVNVAYMMNIVIPRIGEVSRCAILRRYDGVPFPKSLGTIVTERVIDLVCIALITLLALSLAHGEIDDFVATTGLNVGQYADMLHSSRFYIVIGAVACGCLLLFTLLRRYAFWRKMRAAFADMWRGAMSIAHVRRPVSFVIYTILIGVCYYLHFYLTFYSFGFTSGLGWLAGLVMFVVGSFAVVVPTPNGAGPWHYVIIVAMMMYGVRRDEAALFALVVHSLQTSLVVLMGVASLFLLQNKHAAD